MTIFKCLEADIDCIKFCACKYNVHAPTACNTKVSIHVCIQPQSNEAQPPRPKKPRSTVTTMTLQTIGGPEPTQRTFRKSTQHVSQEYKRRFELEEEEQRRRRMYQSRRVKPERKLTQKELLEEAKITERENLASLEAYSRLEAEKKKVEKKKVVFSGPVIRFHSISMPHVSEIENRTIDHSKTESTPNKTDSPVQTGETSSLQKAEGKATTDQTMYTRNFLVFTDTQGFSDLYFPTEKPKHRRKRFCPVTGLPAKYVDPLTGESSTLYMVVKYCFVGEHWSKNTVIASLAQ